MPPTMQCKPVDELPVSASDAALASERIAESSQGTSCTTAAGQPTVDVTASQRSAVERDRQAYFRKEPSASEYLLHASNRSGRSPISLGMEFLKLKRRRGQLTLREYVQYGVYEPDLTFAEKERFITNTLHWPITQKCCDMSWQATTEDKWLCSHILSQLGIPVPQTLAVIDKTARQYPGTLKIGSVAELREFALSRKGEPFFGKENAGICSLGAFLCLDARQDRLLLNGEGWMDYERFLDSFVGSTSYLLQPCQRNHSFFAPYADHLATVRVCILLTDRGLKIPFSVLKLPACENIGDSFWRQGNLACDLDPQTGKILAARIRNAFGTEEHTTHPQSGAPLVGETVPEWDRLLKLVEDCAPIFAPIRYQSMDIAITGAGPVLIEVNTGGGFDLPQLASGRGFLTDDVLEFFHAHGWRS